MWYKNDYRRIFMDMHLNDSKPEEYLSKLDIDNFVEHLKEAHATSVVVKAKSHVGLHYWPSKYGRIHEGLKRRNIDYVGEMTKKCHENGINVIVYLSQIYDNYAYEQHPAWRIVDKTGHTSRENGERYGMVCPNNSEYRKYVKKILEELATSYSFEGMFLDMPFWPDICYCSSCRERFFRETGNELPRQIDWNDPVWADFFHRRQRWMEEFMLENTKTVKSINPNISIEHNFASIGNNWLHANTEMGLQACDYAGGDYYGGYLQQSFICKYYNSVTPNKPFCYITSRCDPNLIAHTVSRSKEDLLIHGMNALMHNGAFSICDAMNPDGTFTDEMYEGDIREVFNTISKYENIVSGDICANVSILYHTERKFEPNFIQSPLNVAAVLLENNIPYNVIGSKNLKNINTQVLCVNDVPELTDEETQHIENCVTSGGKLFITGKLGNARLEELLDVEIKGKSDYTYTYLSPTEKGAPLLKTFNSKSPYPVDHFAWEAKIKSPENAQILATLTYPYTKPNSFDFAAIHSNPPGIRTELPAIIRKKVSKGEIIWIAAPLELSTAAHCKECVLALINSLITEDKKFLSNAPTFVELIMWEKDGEKYLGAVNQQTKLPVYPISGITVTVPEEIEKVCLLSDENKEIPVRYENNKSTFSLPTLDIFQIYKIVTKNK